MNTLAATVLAAYSRTTTLPSEIVRIHPTLAVQPAKKEASPSPPFFLDWSVPVLALMGNRTAWGKLWSTAGVGFLALQIETVSAEVT